MSSSDDTAWPLPKTWAWTTAGQIAQVIGGGTPDTKDPENFGGSIPWITPADMSTHVGKTIAGGSRFLTERGLLGSGAKWLPEGTVLFSSRAPIGYTAVASRQVTTNQGFKSFAPESGVTSDYLYHWLASSKERAEKLASGTTFLELSGAKAALVPVPLAPLAEQVRVIEKLEELLSDLNAGVAELKAAQRKLTQYRQSLLKAAVEGTLTADWRAAHGAPQEPGSELLQRILTERRARWEQKQLAKFAEQGKTPPKDWQSKYPVPVAPDLVDLPELPKGWTWATVDQCTIDDDGITDGPFGSNLKSEHYTEAGPRVIRLQNIGDGRFLDARAYISEDRYESLRKHAVIEGDVVIAMLGEVLPRACAIPKGVVPAIVKADCARVRLNQDLVFSDFVVTALNAEPIRKRVNTLVKGIGRPRINLGTVRSIALPLPPKAEQYRILEVLSESLESCSSQSLAIENGVALSSAQRKNILKAAFSGNLVPQDPNDEPASELLTRIRAEREKQAKLPRALQTKQRKEISAVARQLMDVLTEAGDWMSAQEAFRRCGIGDGAKTDQIEAIYTQMRALDKASRLAVEPVNDVHGRKLYDILKLTAG